MAKFVITEENNKAQSALCQHAIIPVCRMDGALCGLNTMLCFINAIIHTYSRTFSLFSPLRRSACESAL